jgi:AraC-like DNA-binding protein
VLTSQTLAVHRDFGVYTVQCRNDHRGWSADDMHDGYRIVLVRRGRFRRQADGVSAYVDPTLGYVGAPGQEERFSHPAGGDTCTAIRIDRRLWSSVATAKVPEVLRVDAAVDLAHRRLLLSARESDVDFAVTERLVDLAISAAGRQPRIAPSRTDAALMAMACEAIGADHPAAAGLIPLADLFGVSPYRLSRVFSARMGISITRYRNRMRAGRAVDAIEAGEAQLGTLARRLGFADQAHLTRTVKQHYGHTPTALRELLRHASQPPEEHIGAN